MSSPAWAGAEMALAFFGKQDPTITSTFLSGDWQSWNHTGGAVSEGVDANSPTGYAYFLNGGGGDWSKTVVTGSGTFSLWVKAATDLSSTCTFYVDSETPVSCMPGSLSTYTEFSQALTAGTHTLTIHGSAAAVAKLSIDDISYTGTGQPLWTTQGAINGITSISDSGMTDTGTQTGMMSAGTISVNTSCSAPPGGGTSDVKIYVDGAEVRALICAAGETFTNIQKTYTVSAGSHPFRVVGTASAGTTFSADTIYVPMP